MAKVEFSGTLIHVGQPEKKSDKFTLQEVVVEIPNDKFPQYPIKVCLQLSQKQLEHASKLKIGQPVEVKANISAREYKGKYYNSVEAWFLKQEASKGGSSMQPNQSFDSSESSDLPF